MVRWSGQAKADLHNIFHFIATDSRYYARKTVDDIVEKTSQLDRFPQIGRVLPELSDNNIREIPVYSYRLIYEITPESIDILAIAHKRRNLTPEDLQK